MALEMLPWDPLVLEKLKTFLREHPAAPPYVPPIELQRVHLAPLLDGYVREGSWWVPKR